MPPSGPPLPPLVIYLCRASDPPSAYKAAADTPAAAGLASAAADYVSRSPSLASAYSRVVPFKTTPLLPPGAGSRSCALLPPQLAIPPPPAPPTPCFRPAVGVPSRWDLCSCATSAAAAGRTILSPPSAAAGTPAASGPIFAVADNGFYRNRFLPFLPRCVSHRLKSHAVTVTSRSFPILSSHHRAGSPPAITTACASCPRTTCALPRLTRRHPCRSPRRVGKCPSLVHTRSPLPSYSAACLLGSPSGASELYFRAFCQHSFAVLSEILIRKNCRWFPPPPLHSCRCPSRTWLCSGSRHCC